jgi:23S rRNA-/tRNA-specific pseudouridylate synthase
LLFALNPEAAFKFQEALMDRERTTKEYIALCRAPSPPFWINDTPLTNLKKKTKKSKKKKNQKKAAAAAAAKAATLEPQRVSTEPTTVPNSDAHPLQLSQSASLEMPSVPEEPLSEAMDTAPTSSDERQPAITHFTTLATFYRLSLIKAKIFTGSFLLNRCSLVLLWPEQKPRLISGRTHQIRRHLNKTKNQIIGDHEYGKSGINNFFATEHGISRLCLHAWHIEIPHPYKPGFALNLVDPFPQDLRALIEKLPMEDRPGNLKEVFDMLCTSAASLKPICGGNSE